MTFVYNLRESMTQNIFERCSPVADDFAKGLFHKSNNRDRMDLLSAFVAENEKHQDIRDAILHCVLCYDIFPRSPVEAGARPDLDIALAYELGNAPLRASRREVVR